MEENQRRKEVEGNQVPSPIKVRHVLTLAWPIMVSMFSYTIMSLADAVYVGWLGTDELAAVGLAGIFAFLITSFGAGLMGGVKVLVSQCFGSGELEEARRFAWQGIWLALGIGVLTMATAPTGSTLFTWSGADARVEPLSTSYFFVRALGSPVVFVQVAMASYFQGIGDTKTPMRSSLLANGLNILLDPLFIFGAFGVPGLGVEGAAIATVLAQAVGLLYIAVRYLPEVREVPARFERSRAGEVWRMGAPMGARWFFETAGYVVFSAIITHVNAVELAAHVIVVRIMSASFLPGYAIAEATSVLTGQSVGASLPRGIRQAHLAGSLLAGGVMLGFGVLFWTTPELLVGAFGASPEVTEIGATLLMFAATFQVFDALSMVTIWTLNGMGDTRASLIISFSMGWGLKLPLGYYLALPLGMGALGAWIGAGIELALLAGVAMLRLIYKAREFERAEASTSVEPTLVPS